VVVDNVLATEAEAIVEAEADEVCYLGLALGASRMKPSSSSSSSCAADSDTLFADLAAYGFG
jgi:hypothetical protein